MWLYDFDVPLGQRRRRWQAAVGLRRWRAGERADRAGQWRVEAVLATERRVAPGSGGQGQRWVHVRWSGRDPEGEPWGTEWVWNGLLNTEARAEARGIEQEACRDRRAAAARAQAERRAARASSLTGDERARAERRSSRSKGLGKEAAGPRRSRRGKPAELGRRCVTKEQGARESERPWQGRERRVLHVLALDGDGRLERALVRLRLADGSRFTAWVAAGDLRGRQRRNARARWALRVHTGRAAADSGDGQRLELARELGRRRVAALKRRREETDGADDTLGERRRGYDTRQGDMGAAAGGGSPYAGRKAQMGRKSARLDRREGQGEAMAVDAQSARADGGFGEARLPVSGSPFGDG